MDITFLGAAKTVTGSCFHIQTDNTSLLVDCGMFQGLSSEEFLNHEKLPLDLSKLDYIILTHAHIDHSGRIPKVFRDGFRGKVISTKATAELCGIMLPDSGHIQEFETEWKNRKRQRAGKTPILPLYTQQDAVECMSLFKPLRYFEDIRLNDEIRLRFNEAGHILGSSILEMWVGKKGGNEIKIVFSGDLGNRNMPILRDPSIIKEADYVVMESTYGNHLHEIKEDSVERFIDIIIDTIDRGGNIIIPSFSVGRTQEVIYHLNKYIGKYHEKLKRFINIPVFIDSPLAISATKIFRNNLDCYDEEAREYISNGDNPLDFPGLHFTRTADESKALNYIDHSIVIVSSSGMCEAGRIKHHLKHNLWKKNSSVIFVGFQAQGTLGRRILDGNKKVRIFGEDISVNARIEMIEGLSGHADKIGLLKWLTGFEKKPQKVFIVHGEQESMLELSKSIREELSIETVIPDRGEKFDLHLQDVHYSTSSKRKYADNKRMELLNILDGIKEQFEEEILKINDDINNYSSSDEYIKMINEKLNRIKASLK